MNKKRKIVLASSSPRRKKLLKQKGVKFKIINSKLDENNLIKKYKKKGFKNLVKILSLAKVKKVCKSNLLKGDEIVVGFDTIVICKNKVIGKPKNKRDALRKLLLLSNKEHKVLTGIAIIDLKKSKTVLDFEETKVSMKKISKHDAISYIKTKEPLDKAGAYAIQGKGGKFVKDICGDYFNVVGLPLNKFLLILKRLF